MPILVLVYLNRQGLSGVLASRNLLGTEPNLNEFIVGFNQSSPFLSIVDVGSGKEAADAKIRGEFPSKRASIFQAYILQPYHLEMLRLHPRAHQVKKIYSGGPFFAQGACLSSATDESIPSQGAHDGGYARDLTALQTEGLLDKVYLLDGNRKISVEIERLDLPKVALRDIFHSKGLDKNRSTHRPTANCSGAHSGIQLPAAQVLRLALPPAKPPRSLPVPASNNMVGRGAKYNTRNMNSRHHLEIDPTRVSYPPRLILLN